MAVIVFQFITKQKEIKNLQSELITNKKIVDSLNSELFVTGVQLTRYEETLKKMRETDSTCSLLFEYIMEAETE